MFAQGTPGDRVFHVPAGPKSETEHGTARVAITSKCQGWPQRGGYCTLDDLVETVWFPDPLTTSWCLCWEETGLTKGHNIK